MSILSSALGCLYMSSSSINRSILNSTLKIRDDIYMSIIPKARLNDLAKASSKIFSTTYNPTASRNGNKILRQRLRGPALRDYYPTENVKLQTIIRAFPELGLVDEAEEIRKADVDARKRRKYSLVPTNIRWKRPS